MTEFDIPVVLVHGCGGSAASTFPVQTWVEPFAAAGRKVVLATLPGHAKGDSTNPADYHNLAGTLLDTLPAHFDAVGFSLGAKLLLEIAVRAPERVGRLVAGGVGDNLFAPERAGPLSALALEEGINDSTPPPIIEFYRSCLVSGVALRCVAAVLRRPPNPVFDEASLSRISSPVLVISGSSDPIASVSGRLKSALQKATFIQIPDVDHFGLPGATSFQQHALAFLSSPT